jgi:hypothetical protein
MPASHVKWPCRRPNCAQPPHVTDLQPKSVITARPVWPRNALLLDQRLTLVHLWLPAAHARDLHGVGQVPLHLRVPEDRHPVAHQGPPRLSSAHQPAAQ